MCPHGVAAVLPTLFEAMLAQKWQTNEGACKSLQVCCVCVCSGCAVGGGYGKLKRGANISLMQRAYTSTAQLQRWCLSPWCLS